MDDTTARAFILGSRMFFIVQSITYVTQLDNVNNVMIAQYLMQVSPSLYNMLICTVSILENTNEDFP